MSQHDEGEDLLLERLREATSGEASVRQLRRRYDLLRRDYEVLLDRLAELEERLAVPAGGPPQPPEPPAPPPAAPARRSLTEILLAPLLELRDEYSAAANSLGALMNGLDDLSQGVLKGQRISRSGEASGASAPPPQVEVEVQSGGFGSLLDFQERLAGLPGVARVSIHAIDSERATFAIELER